MKIWAARQRRPTGIVEVSLRDGNSFRTQRGAETRLAMMKVGAQAFAQKLDVRSAKAVFVCRSVLGVPVVVAGAGRVYALFHVERNAERG